MKNRVTIMALILCLLMNVAAYAERENETSARAALGSRWAKGTVQVKETIDLFAPVGGQLDPFDIEAGDTVDEGALLLSIHPTEIRAAADGTVRSLQAQVGDMAADVIAQYGALCFIDKDDRHLVKGTTTTAYDKADNRAIRIGEVLRLYNGKESDPKETTGTVIAIEGKEYKIEIEDDLYDLEDEIRVYRGTGDSYKAVDRVGKGTIALPAPVAVMGDGVIASVAVEDGQKVSRGDVLFHVDAPSAIHNDNAQRELIAPKSGMIARVLVQPGQMVSKGQLLMELHALDSLEFVVDVDELDLPSLKAGQVVQVKVDAMPNGMYAATVEKISPLPIPVLDATKYAVTLSVHEAALALLPGMHVTAYWE